jgi:uncharacterized lipoprotein
MKPLPIMIAALTLAISTGCALTKASIPITYSPMRGVQPLQTARGVTVSVEVTDLRTDKTRVSRKKNGVGMSMAAIVPEEDPAITIKNAIELELRARGLSTAGDGAVLVKANLTKFWSDYKTGFFTADAVAELSMSVSVGNRSNEKVLYTVEVQAEGLEANNVTQGGGNAKLSLERALANAIKNLFEDTKFIDALSTGGSKSAVMDQ